MQFNSELNMFQQKAGEDRVTNPYDLRTHKCLHVGAGHHSVLMPLGDLVELMKGAPHRTAPEDPEASRLANIHDCLFNAYTGGVVVLQVFSTVVMPTPACHHHGCLRTPVHYKNRMLANSTYVADQCSYQRHEHINTMVKSMPWVWQSLLFICDAST